MSQRRKAARADAALEFRWASETCANGLPHPQELIYLDYKPVLRDGTVVRDPRYPASVLMVRDEHYGGSE